MGKTREVTAQEINAAYWNWARQYPFRDADESVGSFLSGNMLEGSQLKLARESLFITGAQIGEKLNVTSSNYYHLERSEREGRISLSTLQKAAEAMDCELVYAIRPKQRQTYSRVIWDRTYPRHLTDPNLIGRDIQSRPRMLSYLVSRETYKGRWR